MQTNTFLAATATESLLGAGFVLQNPPHCLGGSGKEMNSAFATPIYCPNQAKVFASCSLSAPDAQVLSTDCTENKIVDQM